MSQLFLALPRSGFSASPRPDVEHGLIDETHHRHIAWEHAWLGVATTLQDARGRGSQNAILAARIRAATEAGACVLSVETSDRIDGAAGPAFRNVVRAGFQEAYRQQWWHPPNAQDGLGEHS